MTGADTPQMAWRDRDVVLASVTTVIGAGAIVGAWFGASGTASVASEIGWLDLAVAGFVVSAVGNGLWLQRGRRAIGERRVALVALDPVEDQPLDEADVHDPGPGRATMELSLVRATGMTRVHHPDCPLVAGKFARPASADDGDPCGVCGS